MDGNHLKIRSSRSREAHFGGYAREDVEKRNGNSFSFR